MNKVHALVPLNCFSAAKTRLSTWLTPAERAGLVVAMARDVLTVLRRHPRIAAVTLLSPDPAAAEIAAELDIDFVDEAGLNHRGLNGALAETAAGLRGQGAQALLVCHADLPLMRAGDVDAVLDALPPQRGVVIATDMAGQGTNMLLFSADYLPRFEFGEDSQRRHADAARVDGMAVEVLQREGLALDVDELADIAHLIRHEDAGLHTRQFLLDSGLAQRMAPLSESQWQTLRKDMLAGELPSASAALSLAACDDTPALMALAGELRDRGHGNLVTYSRKVFIPLTQLCRDVCHYCTFAQTPKRIDSPFMPVEEVLELCRRGAAMGCQEALFTLGERPELRYNAARAALAEMGYGSTLEYLRDVAARVLQETGLLPHINAGCMTAEELASLRQVSASMGIMLESSAPRLCDKGMPHYGSPDKQPERRLETLELAGQAAVPFTSGILIGIGETRRERIESMLALRDVHARHGHLQEVIIQNFRAKPGTLMAEAPEPDLEELLWTIAVARLVFGARMSIQAPPNLSPGVLQQLVAAGINDWGGVSPLTPDHVNPEAPWPHLDKLARETAAAGKFLDQRLTIYPAYVAGRARWLDPAVHTAVLNHSDSMGFARRDPWVPGEERDIPEVERGLLALNPAPAAVSPELREIVKRCRAQAQLADADIERLFQSRGADFAYLVKQADDLRASTVGDSVSYVVNRNINYTNVCYFKCQFCAFSKGKASENLRGRPYDISGEEIARRCTEAWERGATEVCMQGGIHPDYTGQTYLDILHTVHLATPGMHVHAFSPLEVWQGAQTLGIEVRDYLRQLRDAGLGTLPGTAAEILHDEVRAVLCPDKLDTAQWLHVMEAAHELGLRTTATIMYGHVEAPRHWARHLRLVRELQQRSGGFTEFVPLPFVHMEAPLYLKGNARRGPTFREAVLMHAVARLVFHGLIDNIQTSWVKMGAEGVATCLAAGANDLGGTLMNESITRAAGSGHGQEWSPTQMEQQIRRLHREPRMRTTLYADAPEAQRDAAFAAAPLAAARNASAGKRQRDKLIPTLQLAASGQPRSPVPAAGEPQVFLLAACD